MAQVDKRFLGKLENSVPKLANNYMLSTYSIILEAWRRGLEISISIKKEASGNIEPYYTIKSSKRKHKFSATRGDLVPRETIDTTKNKQTTREILLKNSVPTPIGKDFDESVTTDDVVASVKDLTYPLVVKPLNGTGGRGVIANIKNEKELIEAITYVRNKLNFQHIIVEEYFEGEDYRVYIIGGKVAGAIKRLRAHVVGDGKKAINELIEDKNKQRAKLPSLTNRPIKVDDETHNLLNQQGYTLDSIPERDSTVYLKTKNNVSAGGDSIEVTDELSENIKQIAIKATESFTSMVQAGVDLIVDEENDRGVVIELNTRAHITQHLFPIKGKASDVPAKIIDFYFPETLNTEDIGQELFYLDYDYIYNSCLSRNAVEIKLPQLPKAPLVLKRYIVSNCSYSESLAKKIRRVAYNNKVDGYIKPLDHDKFVIIVGGNEGKVNLFKKQATRRIKKNNPDAKIQVKKRLTPIKHGFHIEHESTEPSSATSSLEYFKKYSSLKKDYQRVVKRLVEYEQMEKEMHLTKKQNKNLKKRLGQIESSTSWKVTKPLRKIMKKK